jgi:hypothetical protein
MNVDTQDQLQDARIAWQLVQLRLLASDASAQAAALEERLEAIDFDALRSGAGVELSGGEFTSALDSLATVIDTVGSMEQLAAHLSPRDHVLEVSADEILHPVADALSAGSADVAMVRLAVRMLPRATGFNALANAIESDPAALAGWDDLTVGELVAEFRDIRELDLQALSEQASVELERRWADLSLDAAIGVAAALRGLHNG